MEKFVDKVAVVTGSGSGIGAATSKQLVKFGLHVVGLDINAKRLKEVSDELQKKNYAGKFIWKICDVRNPNEITTTFKSIAHDIGHIWILVNCAGVLIRTTLLDADNESISNTLDTNVKGLLLCAKEAMNSMINNSIEGHIINVNSINGHYIRNRPDISTTMIYAASKHAVTVLTEGLRREIIKRDGMIKCSSVSPGYVKTNLTDEDGKSQSKSTECLLPENIADAVIAILNTPPTVLISELTVMAIYQEI